jgi:hypothetical protein
VAFGAGAALAAGGVALAVVEQGKQTTAENDLNVAQADISFHSGRVCDQSHVVSPQAIAACAARVDSDTSAVNDAKTGQTIGWVMAGVGAAASVTGLVLLLTGDDPHRYDEKPAQRWTLGSIRPEVSPGRLGVSVAGTF